MSQHTTVRPASVRRGAVSRFNDNTMEYVIALARVLTGAFWLGWVAACIVAIVFGSTRWGAVAAFLFALFTLCGWFGFKVNGNEEWRHGKTD